MEKFNGYLYHIVRYKKLELGQKLNFNQTQNYFAKNMFDLEFSVNNQDVNLMLQTKEIEFLTKEEKKILNSYVYESCMQTRELILENVRLKDFPDRPSRFQCLFCSETLEDTRRWVLALKRMSRQNPPLQIVKLKAKGKIFKGDGDLMLRNTHSLNSKVEMAKIYWRGQTYFNSLNKEILFQGNAQVVEIIEEF